LTARLERSAIRLRQLKRPNPSRQAPVQRRDAQEYSVGHHLDGKSAAIVDLFEQIDECGRSLGADVSRRVRKQYFGYFRGKRSFFTIEIQRQRLLLYLSLDPADSQALERGGNARGPRDRSLRHGPPLAVST